ncbi:MAG: formyltransferase family protein [Chloroflexota bacterium]
MNILFLGYKPYLAYILVALKDTPFFLENRIDIIFADPPPLKLKNHFYQSLLQQEPALNLSDLKQQVKQAQNMSQQHFLPIDLHFLSVYPQIRQLPYDGLDQLPNLSSYDYMIVASYAHKIPAAIFDQPKYGTINIHPSYLPDLRGGYPTYIQAFHPRQKLGTTLHIMAEGWDDGDIVRQIHYESDKPLTNDAVLGLSAQYAGQLLNELYQMKFCFTPQKQDLRLVTTCRDILRRKHKFDEIEGAADFEGYLRANYDRHLFPYTYTLHEGQLFIILMAQKIRPSTQMYDWPERMIMSLDTDYYLWIEQEIYQVTHFVFDSVPNAESIQTGL